MAISDVDSEKVRFCSIVFARGEKYVLHFRRHLYQKGLEPKTFDPWKIFFHIALIPDFSAEQDY